MTASQIHTQSNHHAPTAEPELRSKIVRTLADKTFCTLATVSPAGHPHSAGVVYEYVDGTLWIHLERHSRKGRNIAANPSVGVTVPFRRMPVGPPFTIHFQAAAELVAMDDQRVTDLLAAGRLGTISGHGALDMPDGCFLAMQPRGNVHSFGPGARMIDLIRDPLTSGARRFAWADAVA